MVGDGGHRLLSVVVGGTVKVARCTIGTSFSSLVKNSWVSSEAISSSSSSMSRFQHLHFLTNHIIDWNKIQFENLFQWKNLLIARLRRIQFTLSWKPFTFLCSLEQQLIQDYNNTLHQEYLFWQLKSRILWLKYGDTNTKFLLKTLQHRSQSWIVTLKEETRSWISGDALNNHITHSFKILFTFTVSHLRSTTSLGQTRLPNSPFWDKTICSWVSLNLKKSLGMSYLSLRWRHLGQMVTMPFSFKRIGTLSVLVWFRLFKRFSRIKFSRQIEVLPTLLWYQKWLLQKWSLNFDRLVCAILSIK